MGKPPAFPLYAQDALVGTALFSCEEFGAYMRLLLYQWTSGGLPDDPKSLRLLTGAKVSAKVLAKFDKGEDGLLRNERMEMERAKQASFREKQRANGNLGGRPKSSHIEAKDNPSLIPTQNPRKPSPQDEEEEEDAVFCDRQGIPKGMRTPEFIQAWRDWCQFRSEKDEQPFNHRTGREHLTKLERIFAKDGISGAIRAISEAISGQWKQPKEQHELRNHYQTSGNSRAGTSQSQPERNALKRQQCEDEGIELPIL